MTIPPEVLARCRQMFLDVEFNEGWQPALNSAISLAYAAGAAGEGDRIKLLALEANARCCQAAAGIAVLGAPFADLLAGDQS